MCWKRSRRFSSRLAHRFQQVDRAPGIDLEIVERLVQTGRDRRLRGEMENRARIRQHRLQSRQVPDIDKRRVNPRAVPLLQPGKVLVDAGAAQIIDQDDIPALPEKAFSEIAADENRIPP